MKALGGNEIRRRWIAFFEKRGHKYIPGVSLIPQGDKSLLWVNAGVTGLKKYFDGSEIPPSRRIVNVQKSIRTNDIENVGRTARHHTFFEMLGNFSIGDYFRKEVIPWAMEILTSEEEGFGMPLDKLYATYNPADTESRDLWIKCGMAPDHLVPLEGNFWQIGEGPCGPNTEVFFDRGEKYDPEHLGKKLLEEELENDRYIEIWGIVFSQFQGENGVPREKFKELPSKNIDTGAGLERIACILQGTETNFETDLFMPIVHAAEKLSGAPYAGDNLMSYRVIADHARCLTFALSDGAEFSNDGRGYVLRRILRRAMRYGQKIGLHGPFLHKLVDSVVDMYDGFYPELLAHREKVKGMILSEEKRFESTLESGEKVLESYLEKGLDLTGEEAFKLYDTYGFPLELTVEIAGEKGLKVDTDAFEKLMEEQRDRARKARGEIESFHRQSKDLLAFKEQGSFSYEATELSSKATGLFVDGVRVKEFAGQGEIAFEETPFYVECGGQVSDTGYILGEGVKAKVVSMGKTPAGMPLHVVEVEEGKLEEGKAYTLKVDALRRHLIERNHSCTHLLHAALSHVLGHVEQKGSFVNEDYLRFDYGFDRKPTAEELKKVADEVNEKIAEGIAEKTLVLPIEEAKKLGAEMEFSEKYGDVVRVVTFDDYSREFCGGTHVHSSSDIGIFFIKSESSIASGVRRIEALTSLGAYREMCRECATIEQAASCLGSDPSLLVERAKKTVDELSAKTSALKKAEEKLSRLQGEEAASDAKEVNGVYFLFAHLEGADRNKLLMVGDSLKANKKDYLIFLVGGANGSYPSVCLAGGKAPAASSAFREASPLLLGGGGGKPNMASGAFKNLERFAEAKEKVEALLEK